MNCLPGKPVRSHRLPFIETLFSPHTLHMASRGRTTHPWGRQWIRASPLHDHSPTGATLNGFQGPHDGGQEGQAKVCMLTVPGGHASSWRQHPELARAPIPPPHQAQSIPPSPESPQIKGRDGESGLCLELGGVSIEMVIHPPPPRNVDLGVSTALGSKPRVEARRGVTFPPGKHPALQCGQATQAARTSGPLPVRGSADTASRRGNRPCAGGAKPTASWHVVSIQ